MRIASGRIAASGNRAGGPTDLSRSASPPEALIPCALVAAEGFLLGVATLNACLYPSPITIGALPLMLAMLVYVCRRANGLIRGKLP